MKLVSAVMGAVMMMCGIAVQANAAEVLSSMSKFMYDEKGNKTEEIYDVSADGKSVLSEKKHLHI